MHGVFVRLRRAVMASGPVSFVELAAIACLLTGLAAATFGRHVVDGGFYSDDWSNAAIYRFANSPRFFASVAEQIDLLGSRPVLALLLPVPHALFGLNAAAHLTMALVLGVFTCVCFYLFLRAVGLAPVHAGAVSALALLFPWADSVRLWATASVNTVALCLALLGAFVALRGIERDGQRSVVALWFAAALYALSVLTYEVAGIALLLVGSLYFRQAERSKALSWWAIHASMVGGALLYTALTTEKEVGGISERLDDVPTYSRQAVALFTLSFMPPGVSSTPLRAASMVLAGAIVALAAWRYRKTRDRQLGFWLAFVAASAIAVVSAYALTLGAFLDPMNPGLDNRGNIFAALGFAALVYGLVVTAALMLGPRPGIVAAAVGAVVLIAAGYVARVEGHISEYDRATALQQPILRRTSNAAASLPGGSTIYTFGHPAQTANGIPIFYVSWDLNGAIAMETNDASFHAYPVYETARVFCTRRGVAITYPRYDSDARSGYGATFFLDVPSGAISRIASRAECIRALRKLRPGSDYLSTGAG